MFTQQCSSSSWKKLKDKIFDGAGPPPRQPARLLVTRHPMSRLVSAYRDKYLNGAPLSTYTGVYQRLTHSLQSFKTCWISYWFPALVSRGDVSLEATWNRQSYRSKLNHSNPCNLLGRVRESLVAQWQNFTEVQYSPEDISNVTFSFLDFLKHVLWTRDRGLIDAHWLPQHCLCKPCTQAYDYVIEMTNLSYEARQVFDRLNINEDVQVGSLHSTKNPNTDSDEAYFEGIPANILQEIKLLYKRDFELFGYH